jgi:hypothetical protein
MIPIEELKMNLRSESKRGSKIFRMGGKADSFKPHRKIINMGQSKSKQGSYIVSRVMKEDLEGGQKIVESNFKSSTDSNESESYTLDSSLSDGVKSRAFMSVSPIRSYTQKSTKQSKFVPDSAKKSAVGQDSTYGLNSGIQVKPVK